MSYTFWEGLSPYNGAPIKAIVSGIYQLSQNSKTGPMVQVAYVLRDENPYEAVKNGNDVAVCGNCSFRNGNGCYVNPYQHGIVNAWRTDQGQLILDHIRGRPVRVGEYGNPTVVPYEEQLPLFEAASFVTGYAADWETCDQRYKQWLMASVHTEAEYLKAKKMGWATYRTKHKDDPILPGEIVCPFTTEKRQCINCGLCSGQHTGLNIVIDAHGWKKNKIKPRQRPSKLLASLNTGENV